jgi:hypothetical protein
MEEIKCIGCGATIQTTDPNKVGYVTEAVLEKESLTNVVCMRCHKIKNYNLITKNELSTEEYYKILKRITKKDIRKIKAFVDEFESLDVNAQSEYIKQLCSHRELGDD